VCSARASPSEQLLDKIEEIANIKRGLSLEQRSWTSASGLYVQSADAPFAGLTKYSAGGGKVFASLIFFRDRDGTRTVRKYNPGDWELKVDDTLSFCRLLHRASRVPEGWPPEKIAAYTAQHVVDADLFARVQQAYRQHHDELQVFLDETGVEERNDLVDLLYHKLEEEWPVEWLELTLKRQGTPAAPIDTVVHTVAVAHALGYMVGKGWISTEEMRQATLDLGIGLADAIRANFKGAKCRGAAFAAAILPLVAHATARVRSHNQC
jgi:hypothetical protein